jgi:hypothetical protein
MPPNEERALKASAAIIRQHIGGIAGATRSQHSSCVVKNRAGGIGPCSAQDHAKQVSTAE